METEGERNDQNDPVKPRYFKRYVLIAFGIIYSVLLPSLCVAVLPAANGEVLSYLFWVIILYLLMGYFVSSIVVLLTQMAVDLSEAKQFAILAGCLLICLEMQASSFTGHFSIWSILNGSAEDMEVIMHVSVLLSLIGSYFMALQMRNSEL